MSVWAKWIEADARYLYGLSDNGGVEIDPDRHRELLAAGSAGQLIRPGTDGQPEIFEPTPPTDEALQARERSWRTTELARYEWVATRHRDELDLTVPTTLSAEQFAELLGYRQTLRDWPAAGAFPDPEQRPVPPAWLGSITQ